MQELTPEAVATSGEKILLYGPPGSGKSFRAGTMPDPIYFLVAGPPNELKTLLSPDFKKAYPDKKIYFDYAIEETSKRGQFKTADAFDHLCNLLDEALEQDSSGERPFKSVVIDSVTGLLNFQMNKAMELNWALVTNKEKSALGKLRKDGIVLPGDNDYKSAMSLMWQFMDWVMKIPKHVCVTAHLWREKSFDRATRESTITSVSPLFHGKHREDMPMFFDNVWRTLVTGGGKGSSYEIKTVGDEIHYGKTRMGGVLPITLRSDVSLAECITKLQKALPKRGAQ